MQIHEILEIARAEFLKRDAQLLQFRVHERTVAHRVAVYLEALLPDWHIDCEYNRQDNAGDPKSDWKGRRRFPDIIVHRRGAFENLLVIEAKPSWASKKSKAIDIEEAASSAESVGPISIWLHETGLRPAYYSVKCSLNVHPPLPPEADKLSSSGQASGGNGFRAYSSRCRRSPPRNELACLLLESAILTHRFCHRAEKLSVIAVKYGYKFAFVLSYSSGAKADLWFEREWLDCT